MNDLVQFICVSLLTFGVGLALGVHIAHRILFGHWAWRGNSPAVSENTSNT